MTSAKKRQDRPVPIDKVKQQIELFIANKSFINNNEESKMDEEHESSPHKRVIYTEQNDQSTFMSNLGSLFNW